MIKDFLELDNLFDHLKTKYENGDKDVIKTKYGYALINEKGKIVIESGKEGAE